MIKSVNQIRLELAEIQANHKQLNSFFWGDFLRAYKENRLNYPLMGAFYPTSTLLRNQTQLQLRIYIADKLYKDWSNLNDIESDTLQVCRDIYNTMNNSTRWQTIGRVQSCSVTKFINRGGDEVAGHEMTMNFLIRDRDGVCGLPMGDYDFDQVTGSLCSPVQIYEDGILIDTVPSGGIYNVVSADTTLEVNGIIEGTVVAGSTVDVQLSDSGGVVTPTSVTQVGNDLQIVLPDAPLDLFWELNYNGTDDVIFIPATVNNVGTLTSGSGSNVGTITISTDDVSYGALAFPFTPISGTTYYFKRSTATVTGLYTMTGTYV